LEGWEREFEIAKKNKENSESINSRRIIGDEEFEKLMALVT